jgi:hemolysin-activating ACP:hemolysin acyltransferase
MDRQAEPSSEYHLRLGLVAAAMLRSSEYCQYPIACLAVWIEPAILLEQIHFFFDRSGNLKWLHDVGLSR